MSDFSSARRDDYYEVFRQEYGDGEYALDMATDAARADHQRTLAIEEQRENFEIDLWIDRDNNASHRPSHRPTHDTAGGPTGNVAIGVALVAVFGYGLYRLHKWLFNEEDAPATTPKSEAHTPKMKELTRSTNGDYDYEGHLDAIHKDLNDHLEQPGSLFYMSTEFETSDLVDHFGRFTDPKDIDKFIRGEERVEVLEMAELYKVLLAD